MSDLYIPYFDLRFNTNLAKIEYNSGAEVWLAAPAPYLPSTGGALTGALTFTGTTFAMTPPKLSTTQQNALTPTEGMLIYNTTDHVLAFYTGSAWKQVALA